MQISCTDIFITETGNALASPTIEIEFGAQKHHTISVYSHSSTPTVSTTSSQYVPTATLISDFVDQKQPGLNLLWLLALIPVILIVVLVLYRFARRQDRDIGDELPKTSPFPSTRSETTWPLGMNVEHSMIDEAAGKETSVHSRPSTIMDIPHGQQMISTTEKLSSTQNLTIPSADKSSTSADAESIEISTESVQELQNQSHGAITKETDSTNSDLGFAMPRYDQVPSSPRIEAPAVVYDHEKASDPSSKRFILAETNSGGNLTSSDYLITENSLNINSDAPGLVVSFKEFDTLLRNKIHSPIEHEFNPNEKVVVSFRKFDTSDSVSGGQIVASVCSTEIAKYGRSLSTVLESDFEDSFYELEENQVVNIGQEQEELSDHIPLKERSEFTPYIKENSIDAHSITTPTGLKSPNMIPKDEKDVHLLGNFSIDEVSHSIPGPHSPLEQKIFSWLTHEEFASPDPNDNSDLGSSALHEPAITEYTELHVSEAPLALKADDSGKAIPAHTVDFVRKKVVNSPDIESDPIISTHEPVDRAISESHESFYTAEEMRSDKRKSVQSVQHSDLMSFYTARDTFATKSNRTSFHTALESFVSDANRLSFHTAQESFTSRVSNDSLRGAFRNPSRVFANRQLSLATSLDEIRILNRRRSSFIEVQK
jgi:hypothetical protein